MMHRKFRQCFVLAVAAATVAGPAFARPLNIITLHAKAISAGGIRTSALLQIKRAPQTTAYGIVLDPGPLMTLSVQISVARSKVAAAQATVALARSEAARATYLYNAQHNISQAALQTAQSQLQVAEADQATAQATLAELIARARNDWGAKLAAAAVSGSAPLPQLEGGTELLVEVSLPLGRASPGLPGDPVATMPDGHNVTLRLVSRAPRAAAGVAGPSMYYLMATHNSAPIGTPLTVALSQAGAVPGVLVPRAAVVWHNGRALVFRQTGANSFEPVAVPTPLDSQGGYFVPTDDSSSLQPGQRIVVTNAALLYSASMSSSSAVQAKAAKATGDDED